MQKYIRFGEVPKSGKSLNFIKMTFQQQEDFRDDCAALGYEKACEFVPADCFESGVSCFFADKNGRPEIRTIEQARSLAGRASDQAYMLTGQLVGYGQDGEPVITVESCEPVDIERAALKACVISFLFSIFENASCTNTDAIADEFAFYDHCESLQIDKNGVVSSYVFAPDAGCSRLCDRSAVYFGNWKFTDRIKGKQ